MLCFAWLGHTLEEAKFYLNQAQAFILNQVHGLQNMNEHSIIELKTIVVYLNERSIIKTA
jgi:hypothetical protein